MAESSEGFWILDKKYIQAQAGKPFIHERGPIIKFPPESDSIDNSCLCKYRYLRYFAFYQYVKKDPNLTFFKDLSSDSKGLIDYSTQSDSGFNWQLLSGPHYLGCYPTGTFTLGKWLDVELPYNNSDSLYNVTSPSPYYIYSTTEPNKASLKCMIVSSYRCCNGERGCGIQVQRPSDSILSFTLPVCVQDFYVTNLQEAVAKNDIEKARASSIKGTQQCCVHRYIKKEQLLDCDTAIVRVHHQINADESDCAQECPQCFEALPQFAKRNAMALAQGKKCVNWILWRWDFDNCDKCKAQEVLAQPVYSYQGVPSQVIGKGGGWAPITWHDPQKQYIYCSPASATAYQWTYSQNADLQPIDFVPPPSFTQNPCRNACGYSQEVQPRPGVSDSLAGLSDSRIPKSQLPCNIPDPYARQYKEFHHQEFDIWYLKVSKAGQEDTTAADPCYTTYKVDPQSLYQGGKLKWTMKQIQEKDYQLQRKGYFKGIKFLNFKDKDRFYLAIPSQQDPPETASDSRLSKFNFSMAEDQVQLQDTSQNNCKYLYQVYLMGCRCKECGSNSCSVLNPYIVSTVCTKWNLIGRPPDRVLTQRGICLDVWQESTVQNTFSDLQTGPVGQYVYSIQTSDAAYCGELPEAPAMIFWYAVAKVTPKVVGNIIQTEVTWSNKSTYFEYCWEQPQSFKQGWKASQDPSDSLLQVFSMQGSSVIEPGENCQIYYIKFLQTSVDAASLSGCQIYAPQPYSDSKLLQSVLINWSQSCVPWYRAVTFCKTTVTPVCSNSIVSNRTQTVMNTLVFSDSQSISYGWAVSDKWPPLNRGDLYFQSGGSVLVPPENLCTLYHFSPIQDIRVLDKNYQYSGSQQCPQIQQIIKWGKLCTQKYYVNIAYQQHQMKCTSSVYQDVASPWVYTVQALSDSDISRHLKSGWYNGKQTKFKDKSPATYNSATGVYTLSQCSGTYMVVQKGEWRCSAPAPIQEPPESRAGYTFPVSCSSTWRLPYCYTRVQVCSSGVFRGSGCLSTGGTVSKATLTGLTSGWYNGSNPLQATSIRQGGTAANSSAYYIKFGTVICGQCAGSYPQCPTNPGQPAWPAGYSSYYYYQRVLKASCLNGSLNTSATAWELKSAQNSVASGVTGTGCSRTQRGSGVWDCPNGAHSGATKPSVPTISWPNSCKNYYYYYTIAVTPESTGNWSGPVCTSQVQTTGWYVTPTTNNCVASYRSCVLSNACPGSTTTTPSSKPTYTNWPSACVPVKYYCVVWKTQTSPNGTSGWQTMIELTQGDISTNLTRLGIPLTLNQDHIYVAAHKVINQDGSYYYQREVARLISGPYNEYPVGVC